MNERQKIIQQMLEMQRKFVALEKNGEFAVADYYDPEGGSELAEYKKQYDALAIKLVDMAHESVGSSR